MAFLQCLFEVSGVKDARTIWIRVTIVLHICVVILGYDQGVGSRIARGEVGPASCKLGQLTCSMELEWGEISTHASKATTPSKVFLYVKTNIFKSLYIEINLTCHFYK
jgi:hypothetical protein